MSVDKQQILFPEFVEDKGSKKPISVMDKVADCDDNSLKALIKWPGGKDKELRYIKACAPSSFENYYEPFVGGGAVFTAFNANHLFVNDKSSELISLYEAIATQNKDVFSWFEKVIKAWTNMLRFAGRHQELVDWYLGLRKEFTTETGVRERLLLFALQYEEELKSVLPDSFIWGIDVYLKEIKTALSHKVVRMYKIEKERSEMPREDIFNNIETAFMGALYMYFRDLYNDKCVMQQQKALETVLFVFLRNYAYSGMFRYNADGDFNVPYGGISYNHKSLQSKVDYYQSKELRAHFQKTTIADLDFEEFFRLYKPTEKDFIFLDPPYDTEFSTYANNEFDKDDQQRLANYLCDECKGKWQMIIKYTDYIYSLYQGRPNVTIRKFDKKYQVSFMNRNEKEVEHLIITNY